MLITLSSPPPPPQKSLNHIDDLPQPARRKPVYNSCVSNVPPGFFCDDAGRTVLESSSGCPADA